MTDRGTTSTVSLDSPVTLAAWASKPGLACHSSALLTRKRWIRVLQSRSRARASTSSRPSMRSGVQVMRYCTEV